MRSTAGIAALLVAFMLGLGAGPANAERVFPTLGGPGGGDKQERCERGWYLIGLKVKSGSWTDGVQVICAEILDTNVYRGVKVHDAYFGGNGGGGPTERKCANGERITSLGVVPADTGGRYVRQMDLGCVSFDNKYHMVEAGNSSGKFPADNNRQQCAAGDAATGIHIRYGAYLDAIGLICDKFTPIVTKTAPPPTPTPGTVSTDPKTGCAGLSGELLNVCTEHNVERAKHGVPNLTWDATLAANAAAWVKGCHTQKDDKGNEFFCHQHKPTADNSFGCGNDANYKYGENLSWSSPPPGRTGAKVVDDWYCEIEVYDFNNPTFGNGGVTRGCSGADNPNKVVGHFTQVVWKATTKLGCAQNTCSISGTQHVLWACEYDPPGNFNVNQPGVLAANVPKPVIQGLRARIMAANATQRPTTVMSDVDLYDVPGGNGKKIGILRKGQKLTLMTCKTDNWCQVTGGWVWGSFITRDGKL